MESGAGEGRRLILRREWLGKSRVKEIGWGWWFVGMYVEEEI